MDSQQIAWTGQAGQASVGLKIWEPQFNISVGKPENSGDWALIPPLPPSTICGMSR